MGIPGWGLGRVRRLEGLCSVQEVGHSERFLGREDR